jgi:hypothetical protein
MWCLRLLRKDFEKKITTFPQLQNLFLERGLKIQACKPRAFVGAKRRKIEHASHGRGLKKACVFLYVLELTY